jgi:hypothetical protein
MIISKDSNRPETRCESFIACLKKIPDPICSRSGPISQKLDNHNLEPYIVAGRDEGGKYISDKISFLVVLQKNIAIF